MVSLLEPAPKASGGGTRVIALKDLGGAKFAWCHDGISKNGEFTLNKDGTTGGDFKNWNLLRWKVTGKHEITIDDGHGDNAHKLAFNCEGTGFFVKERRGQRGYIEAAGFESPDDAAAPRDGQLLKCDVTTTAPSEQKKVEIYDVSANGGRLPVWIWWDFPHGVPPSFRMNLRTWRERISPEKFDMFLLNMTNIARFLPGLPPAYQRLYQAARSDFLRASLLAAHGGVYLDGDMLLSSDLDVVVKDLLDGKVDILPYEGPGDKCPRAYTTNFMAGAKGNTLSSEWIDITISKMYQRCQLPESENHREPVNVCCFNKDWCMRKECHVAWGDISHPPSMATLPKNSVRLGCVPFKQGFSYTMNGEELFYKLVDKPTQDSKHCWVVDDDLMCTGIGKLNTYFDRHGHHLYNMLNGYALESLTEEKILKGNMVVSELYRRALRITRGDGG